MRVIAAVVALILIFKLGAFDPDKASLHEVELPMSGRLSPAAINVFVKHCDSELQIDFFSLKSFCGPSFIDEVDPCPDNFGHICSTLANSLKIKTCCDVVRKVGFFVRDNWKINSFFGPSGHEHFDVSNFGLTASSVVDIEPDYDLTRVRFLNDYIYPANGNSGAVTGNKLFVSEVDAFPRQPRLLTGCFPKGVGKGCDGNTGQGANQAVIISSFADDPSNNIYVNAIGGLILASAIGILLAYLNSFFPETKRHAVKKNAKIQKDRIGRKNGDFSGG